MKYLKCIWVLMLGLTVGLTSCSDDGLGPDEVRPYDGSWSDYAGKCGLKFNILDNNRHTVTCTGPIDEIRNATNFVAPLEIPTKVVIDGNEYAVLEIKNWAFEGCSHIRNVVIPNSIKTIGSAAFYRCSSLSQIILPSSLTKIGESAFWGCSSLRKVVMKSQVPPTLDCSNYYERHPFYTVQPTLIVPTSALDAYKEHWTYNSSSFFKEIIGGAENY